MQDRYVGDIGDFGKYGLLRFLFQDSKLRLGVDWCLVPDESYNADGRHINYLLGKDDNDKKKKSEVFEDCDSELYRALYDIVQPRMVGDAVKSTGVRSVARVQKAKILPVHSFSDFKICDVVFVDPDNGLAPDGIKDNKSRPKGRKYIYEDDLNRFYKEGKSLIVYNHRDRKKEDKCLERFLSIHPEPALILRWNRVSVRYYLFILQRKHKDDIEARVKEMEKSRWCTAEGWSKKWYKEPNFKVVYAA